MGIICLISLNGCTASPIAPANNPPPKVFYPIVIAGGSLNLSTIERYNTLAVYVPDASGAPNSGTVVEGVLTTLFISNEIAVIERAQLRRVLDEQAVQLQHGDEAAELAKIGRIAGAKAIVLGTITEWKEAKVLGRVLSSVSLGFKIIDAENGAILFNGQAHYPVALVGPANRVAELLVLNLVVHFGASLGSRGWAGVAWKLTEVDGRPTAVITRVYPDTPAASGGLKTGDLLVSCNGRLSENWKSEWQSMRECRAEPGQQVVFQVKRGNETLSVTMTAQDVVQWAREKTAIKVTP